MLAIDARIERLCAAQRIAAVSYELGIPELRVWPLARFPYLVFYVERDAVATRLNGALADIDEQ